MKKIAGLKEDGQVDETVFAQYRKQFLDAVCNDLNTSQAITVLYDVLKADCNDATKLELVKSFDTVLSLDLLSAGANLKQNEAAQIDPELEAYVLAKIEERKEAKKAKDFAKADAIRAELLEKNIVIEDTREGVKWKLQA